MNARQMNRKMASLFTIEQIELIRRLRNTGMNREMLISGLDEMARIFQSNSMFERRGLGEGACKKIEPKDRNRSQSSEASEESLSEKPSDGDELQRSTDDEGQTTEDDGGQKKGKGDLERIDEETIDSPEDDVRNINCDHDYLNRKKERRSLELRKSQESSDEGGSSRGKNPILYEETEELRRFKSKPDEEILNIIRGFVIKYNIRQNMIAEMTRLSQGYVSRFFRGEMHEMSERARNYIYMWYLQCKEDPTKILTSCPNTVGDKTAISPNGELLPIKRDRFLFRKKHYDILEKYFGENPYPDAHTKEEIAEACNRAVEKSGQLIPERYQVTIQIVSNWFNNKRKEMKSGGRPKNKVGYNVRNVPVGGGLISGDGLMPSTPGTSHDQTLGILPSCELESKKSTSPSSSSTSSTPAGGNIAPNMPSGPESPIDNPQQGPPPQILQPPPPPPQHQVQLPPHPIHLPPMTHHLPTFSHFSQAATHLHPGMITHQQQMEQQHAAQISGSFCQHPEFTTPPPVITSQEQYPAAIPSISVKNEFAGNGIGGHHPHHHWGHPGQEKAEHELNLIPEISGIKSEPV